MPTRPITMPKTILPNTMVRHMPTPRSSAPSTPTRRGADSLRTELNRGLALHLPPDEHGEQQDHQADYTADNALAEHAPLGQQAHAHAQRKKGHADGAQDQGHKITFFILISSLFRNEFFRY